MSTAAYYQTQIDSIDAQLVTLAAQIADDPVEEYKTPHGAAARMAAFKERADALRSIRSDFLMRLGQLQKSASRGVRAVRLSRAGGSG